MKKLVEKYEVKKDSFLFTDYTGKKVEQSFSDLKNMAVSSAGGKGWGTAGLFSLIFGFGFPPIWVFTAFAFWKGYKKAKQMLLVLQFIEKDGSIEKESFHIICVTSSGEEMREQVKRLDNIIEENNLSVGFAEEGLTSQLADIK